MLRKKNDSSCSTFPYRTSRGISKESRRVSFLVRGFVKEGLCGGELGGGISTRQLSSRCQRQAVRSARAHGKTSRREFSMSPGSRPCARELVFAGIKSSRATEMEERGGGPSLRIKQWRSARREVDREMLFFRFLLFGERVAACV